MASKRILRFSSIVDFFKEESKLISRGENSVESNHVKDMQFDADLLFIHGNVHASMRDRLYKVELKLDSDKDISEATCTCPRGQLICHHMAALAIFAYHNISVTDIACSWSVKKANKTDAVKTIDEIFPKKKNHAFTSGTVTDTQIKEFKANLGMFENAVGFTWLLRSEPRVMEEITDIEAIIFSKDYLEADNKINYFQNAVKLTEENVLDITKKTNGQSSKKLWLIARKNRLTASNFGVVLTAEKNLRFPPSLFARLTETYTLDGVKAIQWGKQHDKESPLEKMLMPKCPQILWNKLTCCQNMQKKK